MTNQIGYSPEKLKTEKPLLVLTGPTAVGKTELSISLAKAIGGEIISADSIQVYRGMDIGSAKITREEMDGVPHHLIDVLNPDEEFNVLRFQQMAREAIEKVYENGHIPILAGGTGFYIQALLYAVDFSEETDHSYRKTLEQRAQREGPEALHAELMQVDPAYAQEVHANNVKRVIRALEFYHQTGMPLSKHNAQQHENISPYLFRYFVLNLPREELYRRINLRVDGMLNQGLLGEVRGLRDLGYEANLVSMQGIGYKEICTYLDGACTLEEAIEAIKQGTRHFAKRQITWFKREKTVTWIEKSQFADSDAILQYMLSEAAPLLDRLKEK